MKPIVHASVIEPPAVGGHLYVVLGTSTQVVGVLLLEETKICPEEMEK
jgi:hypothetical protein